MKLALALLTLLLASCESLTIRGSVTDAQSGASLEIGEGGTVINLPPITYGK